MKATAMPVQRPTADSIWSSFQISGKKHLIITGKKGSGKTTLLNEIFPTPQVGITTWAERKNAVYIKNDLTGKTEKIGIYDPALGGEDKKMRIFTDGFYTVGIPALEDAFSDPCEWVTLDEVGYLEAECEEYCEKIRELFDKKRVAAVVRKEEMPFCKELVSRSDAFIVDLDMPFGNLGCVIMASGEGKRFGGNKLTANFHGEPMIMRTIKATEGIFPRRVVVTRHKDVYELCREYGVEVILHDLPYRSDTVRLGLKTLYDTDGCIFCQGDQPLLSRETLAAMSVSFRNDKEAIIRAAYDGNEGAPILFPKWTYPELLDLPEGKGGGYVAKKYADHVRLLNVRDRHELVDVDTSEDLEKLEEYERKLN